MRALFSGSIKHYYYKMQIIDYSFYKSGINRLGYHLRFQECENAQLMENKQKFKTYK